MHHFETLRTQIEQELLNISSDNTARPVELYAPIHYALGAGGKLMRPVLVLAGCELFDGKIEEAIPVALAVELLHNFTLMHDDIMDNAPLRRGKPTVFNKWGMNTAILSGDVMFAKSYELLSKVSANKLPLVLNTFTDNIIKVCEGQQLDMNYEKMPRITISQYLKMIELKTAVLLGASLKMGAIIGGARNEDADRLYQFGKHMGIAFQLQDDILDVYGDASTFGKQKGGDIIANKKTFLLIKALELANRYQAEELDYWLFAPQFIPAEKVVAVTSIFDYLNVRLLAEDEMKKHHDMAIQQLAAIPIAEELKKQLIGFADSLLQRQV